MKMGTKSYDVLSFRKFVTHTCGVQNIRETTIAGMPNRKMRQILGLERFVANLLPVGSAIVWKIPNVIAPSRRPLRERAAKMDATRPRDIPLRRRRQCQCHSGLAARKQFRGYRSITAGNANTVAFTHFPTREPGRQ
jgi:hypothetical protein